MTNEENPSLPEIGFIGSYGYERADLIAYGKACAEHAAEKYRARVKELEDILRTKDDRLEIRMHWGDFHTMQAISKEIQDCGPYELRETVRCAARLMLDKLTEIRSRTKD
jgi:hypothetical protein